MSISGMGQVRLGRTRREFIVGSVCSCMPTSMAYSESAALPGSCSFGGPVPSAVANTGDDYGSSSGQPDLDKAIIFELKQIQKYIPVRPAYRFIDDSNSPTALASPVSTIQGLWGTVYIGRTLIRSEFEVGHNVGGIAVAGILAHECGHIYQRKSGLYDRLTGATQKNVELHADYIGGFYLGRSRKCPVDLIKITFEDSLFRHGDYKYNDPIHHGSPKARVTAMRFGYFAGLTDTDFEVLADSAVETVENIQD